jgi:hypothetical protein
MSKMGHSRHFEAGGDESGLPLTPDGLLRHSEPTRRAILGHAGERTTRPLHPRGPTSTDPLARSERCRRLTEVHLLPEVLRSSRNVARRLLLLVPYWKSVNCSHSRGWRSAWDLFGQ